MGVAGLGFNKTLFAETGSGAIVCQPLLWKICIICFLLKFQYYHHIKKWHKINAYTSLIDSKHVVFFKNNGLNQHSKSPHCIWVILSLSLIVTFSLVDLGSVFLELGELWGSDETPFPQAWPEPGREAHQIWSLLQGHFWTSEPGWVWGEVWAVPRWGTGVQRKGPGLRCVRAVGQTGPGAARDS